MNNSKGMQNAPKTAKQKQRRAVKKQQAVVKAKATTGKAVVKQTPVPIAVGTSFTMGRPSFKAVGTDLIVSHCEFVEFLNGSTAFSVQNLFLNPGNGTLFPWLTALARRFESYIFESLEIHFEPTCPTTSRGAVYMVVDYNPQDPAPTSVNQIMTYEGAVRTSSFMSKAFAASKQGLSKRKTYFVSGDVLEPTNGENLYDAGRVLIAVNGQADASEVGEIYVRYRIRLMTPEMDTATGTEARSCRYTGTSNGLPLGNKVLNVNGISTYMPTVGSSAFYASVSGTTTSVVTFTNNFAWTGYLSIATVGTGIGSQVTTGSTATILALGQTYLPATSITTLFSVEATPGQTIVISTGNTSISANDMVFAESSTPL